MEHNFCRRCGQALMHKEGNMYVCQAGHETYDMAVAGGGLLLLNSKDEVLIAIRGVEPAKGTYDLPGGFCNLDERHLDAAIREAREELGLKPTDYTEPQFLTEAIDRYPYKGETKTVIAVLFWARLITHKPPTPSDDVADILWVPLRTGDFSNVDPQSQTVPASIAAMRKLLSA